MAHQDEPEAQLAHSFSQMAPEVIGNPYLVLGTIDKRVWKERLQGAAGNWVRCCSMSPSSSGS